MPKLELLFSYESLLPFLAVRVKMPKWAEITSFLPGACNLQ
jgi:hypothetical protein